ncbi:MAG: hypothetical protein L0H78_03920 [Humibacillus sp.]|nr:hypothetical protein [Humibacillus sp.]
MLRHDERQGEAAEHPLGGTAPGRMVFGDVDELARERQLALVDAEVGAQLAADLQLAAGQVARSTGEAEQLGAGLFARALQLALAAGRYLPPSVPFARAVYSR